MSTSYDMLDSNITDISVKYSGESNGESIFHIAINGLACPIECNMPESKVHEFLNLFVMIDCYVYRYAAKGNRMALRYTNDAMQYRIAKMDSWMLSENGKLCQYKDILNSVVHNDASLA